MWLEVTAKDSSGKVLLQENQYYKPIFIDENGKDVGAFFWKATRLISDNRIAPRETRTEKFTFNIPSEVALPIVVGARLLYRLAPQEVADKVGIGALPVTVMAEIELSSGAPSPLGTYSLPIIVVVALVAAAIITLIFRRRRQ